MTACAGGGEGYVTANQQPVVGGATDYGADHAVVIIIAKDTHYVGVCTGSLITPHVVLTAGHCVPPEEFDPATTVYRVYFADTCNPKKLECTGLLDDVTRLGTKYFRDPSYKILTNGAPVSDMSLLLVDKDPPAGVVPVPYSRYRVSDKLKGKEIRMVGYGDEFSGADFTTFKKLEATNTVTQVAAQWFTVTDNQQITCQGDSGGPAFLTVEGREVVQGITSFGDPSCAMEANWARVDIFIDEIDKFIAENDPQPATNCGADGICGTYCKTVDPDCPCQKDGNCTTACPDNDLDPDCPLNCGKDNVCQKSGCPAPDPDCGTAVLGAACTKNTDCESNVCGGTVCSEKCGAGNTCPSGFSCAQSSSICMPSSGGCAIATVDDAGRGPGFGGWLALLGVIGFTACRSRRARRS